MLNRPGAFVAKGARMNNLAATGVARTLSLQRRVSELLKSGRNFDAPWKLSCEHASRKKRNLAADERR
jgi:hypothetical protein